MADEGLGLEATYILQNMLKLRVPEDVSLLGMESAQVSQYLSPPMTTLAQPLAELAEKSLELLLQQMDNAQEPQYVVLESRLIERESVARISSD
ncbi:MAG: substrate-binding domain-containing protein [Phycisphaerales bacterium]|nr:substrate-binding domain-containing protein [Phycisphaerales bacterium]